MKFDNKRITIIFWFPSHSISIREKIRLLSPSPLLNPSFFHVISNTFIFSPSKPAAASWNPPKLSLVTKTRRGIVSSHSAVYGWSFVGCQTNLTVATYLLRSREISSTASCVHFIHSPPFSLCFSPAKPTTYILGSRQTRYNSFFVYKEERTQFNETSVVVDFVSSHLIYQILEMLVMCIVT